MALEIERRFLVQNSGWRSRVCWQARLRQGYLHSDADGFTLRVRLSSAEPTEPILTAKPSEGLAGGMPEFVPRLEATTAMEQAWLTLKAAPPEAAKSSHGSLDPAVGDPATGAPASMADVTGRLPYPAALTRLEFEYAIPSADGEQLLALAQCCLAKRRYGLNLPDGDWVVDVFEAENAPLVVAEVELPHANAAFDRPAWCGPELTGWHQLSNAALAQRPLNRWPAAEREALLAGQRLGQVGAQA